MLGELPPPSETANLPSFVVETDVAVAIAAVGLAGLASGSTGNMPSSILPLPVATSVLSPTARLPRKLVEKIQNLDFIEISELLPEAWIPDIDESQKPRRRSPISDILVWVECFILMAADLAEKFPTKAPQLFAYMRRIVHAARNYRGMAWVAYDRLYCRQVAAHRSLDWAIEDSILYN